MSVADRTEGKGRGVVVAPEDVTGYCYLHVNGDLIYKRRLDAPDRNFVATRSYLDEMRATTTRDLEASTFVRYYWPISQQERGCAWVTTVEAAALGARVERIYHLIERWRLTDADAWVFAARVGDLELHFTPEPLDPWMASFKGGTWKQVGFGASAFWALVDLARKGFEAQGVLPFKTDLRLFDHDSNDFANLGP